MMLLKVLLGAVLLLLLLCVITIIIMAIFYGLELWLGEVPALIIQMAIGFALLLWLSCDNSIKTRKEQENERAKRFTSRR